MRRYFFIYILIALFCSNFIVSPLYAGEIRLVGSSTVALVIEGALEKFSEENPDIKVKLDVSNSGRGVRALSGGKADIAMISTPVQVLKFRIAHIDWDRLNAFKIAERKIVFITHKDNPVTHLTQPQIYNILSGRAKNWRAFGGDDERILVVSEYASGGIRATVENTLLEGQYIGAKLARMKNTKKISKMVESSRFAFGIVAEDMVSDKVNEIKLDTEIHQPLFLLTKSGYVSAEIDKLIDYLHFEFQHELEPLND